MMSTTNFAEEMRWRGMLHDMMPGTEELLTKEMECGAAGCRRAGSRRKAPMAAMAAESTGTMCPWS